MVDVEQQGQRTRREVVEARQTVQQHAAGVEGEDALVAGLSRLPDEWVMLRGYRNGRGETDHVLVGPLGVWAVEVKRRSVRVHVAGDTWRYEKLDRWGNVVETGYGTDRSGRSWASQVNDVAKDLAAWLEKNGHPVPIRTAVMILHERAQIGRVERLTVSFLSTNPRDLLKQIRAQARQLDGDARDEIIALIRRDHRFHEARRRRR